VAGRAVKSTLQRARAAVTAAGLSPLEAMLTSDGADRAR
jgi:hypothetical protein